MFRFLSFLFVLFLAGCSGSRDTTAPSISKVSTENIGSRNATIAWSTDEGADTQVQYGTTPSYGSSTVLAAGIMTSHRQTLTGLQPGTLYHYRVLSRDAAGNLATSTDATFSTPAEEASGPPPAPETPAPETPPPPATPAPKPEIAPEPKPETKSEPKPKAEPKPAPPAEATPETKPAPAADRTAPTVPTGLTVTGNSSNQINLNWIASTDDTGVAGYRLFRDGKPIATTPSTGYADKGLSPSTGYSYTVSAFDRAGNASPQSAAVGASTAAPPDTTPPQISGVAIENIGSGDAIIRWITDEPGDSQIEYGATTAYGSFSPQASTLVRAHSQALTGLLPATRYHYRVRSRDAAGNLATSPDAAFTTESLPDTAPPSVPRGLTAAPLSYTQVNVAWNPSTDNVGVAGYRLYRNGIQVATLTGQIYSDGNLTPDTTYRYTVAAYDPAGNLSAQSPPISVHTPPFLSDIAARGITPTGAAIIWTTREPATAQVEYGTTTEYGARSPLDGALATSHTAALTGLTPSTTYHYRVISKDAAGMTVPSADFTFSTAPPPDAVPPSVPTELTAKAASFNQVELTWTPSTDNRGVTGYRIYRNGTQVGTTAALRYIDAGLTGSTTYTYTVSAYDAAGNASEPSAPTAATTPRKPFFGGK